MTALTKNDEWFRTVLPVVVARSAAPGIFIYADASWPK